MLVSKTISVLGRSTLSVHGPVYIHAYYSLCGAILVSILVPLFFYPIVNAEFQYPLTAPSYLTIKRTEDQKATSVPAAKPITFSPTKTKQHKILPSY